MQALYPIIWFILICVAMYFNLWMGMANERVVGYDYPGYYYIFTGFLYLISVGFILLVVYFHPFK